MGSRLWTAAVLARLPRGNHDSGFCHESRSWQSLILLGSGFSIFGGAPHRVRVSVGRRPESSSGAVCGLRSGAAVRKDAELVPLWVGKYDPALIALADVGVSST
jgi:hypothetical protein